MRLEDQGLDAVELQLRIEEFASQLADTRAVWDSPDA